MSEAEKKVKCPLCGETMEYKKLRGNEWWECPVCRTEVWPYDERVEKEIHKEMYVTAPKKKSRGSSKRKRFKPKKPGEKWVPWYRRGWS